MQADPANPSIKPRWPGIPGLRSPAPPLPSSFRTLAGHVGRYGLAVLLAGLAGLLQWAVQPWVGNRIPFLFFMPPLILAAAGIGRGPALLVLAAALVNAMFFMLPADSLDVASFGDQIAILAFGVVGFMITAIGGRLRLTTQMAAEAQGRLLLAQKSAGIGLFEADLRDRTLFASPYLRHLLEIDPSSPDGDVLHSLLALYERHLAAAGRSQPDLQFEHRVKAADGGERWAFSKVEVERDENGQLARLRGAMVDISERKELDQQLRQARDRLQQQVEDLQRLHDLSGRLLELRDLDSELREILGTLVDFHGARQGLVSLLDPATDTLNVQVSQGFSPDGLARLIDLPPGQKSGSLACAEKRRVFIEDTEAGSVSAPLRALARSEGFRSTHSTPLITLSGEVIGVISVYGREPHRPDERETRLSDICARKAAVFIERAFAQTQAQAVEQRFEAVLDASAVPFTVLRPVHDDDGRIVDFRVGYVNKAAARTMQRPQEQLAGQRVGQALPQIWRQPGLLEHYTAVAELNEVREFDLHADPSSGDSWFHVIASPVQGTVAVWYADVTDYRRQELALKEADRRKDEFLAVLAHELRNPLAPIRQAAAIFKAPYATEEQKRWSQEVIDRQVKHMALLLDDLLDVSRITRGTLHLRSSLTELRSIVEAAVETARPLIDSKRHRLDVSLPPGPLRIVADPLRLAQVLSNLLTNAAKYTDPEGRIRLEAKQRGAEVVISVCDNGIGLEPQDLERAFDMFAQVRSAHERSAGGLGIGLALARGLVEMHGGRLEAASEGPGRGSCFTVCLPDRPAPGQNAAPVLPSDEPDAHAQPRARRILVADDNRDAAESLAEILRLQGHDVALAFDGQQAVDLYRQSPFDVVLLDVGMPVLSGLDAARQIRGHDPGHRAILIAITGWGQSSDRHKTSEAGFDHHLTKPVDLDKLNRLMTPTAG